MYIITFILVLIPFLFSSFSFKIDNIYYNGLLKPNFIFNGKILSFIWIIIFILLSISITKCLIKNNKNKDYLYTVISNYVAIYLYLIGFFDLKSPLLGSFFNICVLVSSLFLLKETKKIDFKSSLYIIPYIIINSYSLVISIIISIMNF